MFQLSVHHTGQGEFCVRPACQETQQVAAVGISNSGISYGLFKDSICKLRLMYNGRIIVNNTLERMWKCHGLL